jgi:hypothetical protein|tara:strand:- start:599 stop:997 length:399 start_codon:yes stop_codon:yes gene_type:complete
MLVSTLEARVAFYNKPELVENPFHPAGFNGTFAFSSHNLIPEVFLGFLQRHFGHYRIRKVPLESINALLNELWEGPGSLEKLFRLEDEMRANGKEVKFSAADIASIKSKQEDEEENDSPLQLATNFNEDETN